MEQSYDVVTVGGGIGGAAFAKVMAEAGRRVLVVERTSEFRDRVRGEALVPWGCVEAERLGLLGLLEPLANRLVSWTFHVGGRPALCRNMPKASGTGHGVLCFYHPRMQEVVLEAARAAGADVVRGARVTAVSPGRPAHVTVLHEGSELVVEAALVAGCDGRESPMRKWAGFATERERPRRLFGGVFFENVAAPTDAISTWLDFERGLIGYLFPQPSACARTYVGCPSRGEVGRLQGEKDVERFVDTIVQIGAPEAWIRGAKANGPLATFDATDEWVPHPYRDGVALIGDAAATSDPTWGQGMALTLRDARVLSEALAADADVDRAGHAYAVAHDEHSARVRLADSWFTDLFLEVGAEADARRARALPAVLRDESRIVETPLAGPDWIPTEAARRRFFAED